MKILIAAESFIPRSNGVTNSVLYAADHLQKNGHSVRIIAPGVGPNEIDGLFIHRVPALSLQRLAQIDIPSTNPRHTSNVIEVFQPDIAYLASPFLLGEQVRAICESNGIPTVSNYQTDVAGFMNFYGLGAARKLVENRIRRIHINSTLTLSPSTSSDEWLRSLGVSNIERWSRGVDHKKFHPNWRSQSFRENLGVSNSTLLVGYVGRLAPEKQIEKLLQLSDLDFLLGRKISIVIIGGGPSEKYLKKNLKEAIFLGHLSGKELSIAMASLDLLITTGENETFCQVVQEGMAAGLPVISPNAGGPRDLITHGYNGLHYEVSQPNSLKLEALKILSDDSLRKTLAKNAFKSVENRSWKILGLQLESILANTFELTQAKALAS